MIGMSEIISLQRGREVATTDLDHWARPFAARLADVAGAALLLASTQTRDITDKTTHVDAGFHVDGMMFH